jgi:bacterioferritin
LEAAMQGNPELIQTLNELLARELTAISQYIVHAEMNGNWGYNKLHEYFEKRSIDEMRHAETLIERILFLEGRPTVSKLNQMHIGADVPAMLANDLALEMEGDAAYNAAIKQAGDLSDFATREIVEKILQQEDEHIDKIEEYQDQIEQMGLQLFLSTQV